MRTLCHTAIYGTRSTTSVDTAVMFLMPQFLSQFGSNGWTGMLGPALNALYVKPSAADILTARIKDFISTSRSY